MANRYYTQFFGTLHKKPVLLDCQFVVDVAAPGGAGIKNFTGAGIASVFMNTTVSFTGATHTNSLIDAIADTSFLKVGMPIQGAGIVPGTVITSIQSPIAIRVNPPTVATSAGTVPITYQAVGSTNPAPGYIVVNFQDFYNTYYFGASQLLSAPSGAPIGVGALVIGTPYMIVSVGTTTQAQWTLIGVPKGVKAAPGVTFFSKAAAAPGTGTVQAFATSGSGSLEIVGNPNATLGANYTGNSTVGDASGAYIIFKALDPTGAIGAPVVGTGVTMGFFLSNSALKVNGS